MTRSVLSTSILRRPVPTFALALVVSLLVGGCRFEGEVIWPVMRSGSEFRTAAWWQTVGVIRRERAIEIASDEAMLLSGEPDEVQLGQLVLRGRLSQVERERHTAWAVVWEGSRSRQEVYVDAFSGEVLMVARSGG